MKNRRISVIVSKTVNIGNFESMKVQAGIECDIADDENIETAYDDLWDLTNDQLDKELGTGDDER